MPKPRIPKWLDWRKQPYSHRATIEQAKEYNSNLLSAKKLAKIREEIREYTNDSSAERRWMIRRWMLRTRKKAADQHDLLEKCRIVILLVNSQELGERKRKQFVTCFSSLGKELGDLPELGNAVDERDKAWGEALKEMETIRLPTFLTHAFLTLSNSTQIEMASLFVGGLIALGAAHMTAFFWAAIGEGASPYWTLNDLIVQGIEILVYVIPTLIILEGLLSAIGFSRRSFKYKMDYWVVEHPVRLVGIFLLATAVVVVAIGHFFGKKALNDFLEMDMQTVEMATVLDGTVLRNVQLISTTDRTAVFLQADIEEEEKPTKQILENWRKKQPNEEKKGGQEEREKHYTVLIMDRALIVCHAKDSQCESPKKDDNTVAAGIKDLDGRLSELDGTLINRLDAFSKGMDRKFEDIDAHMDRHRALDRVSFDEILAAIDEE